MNDRIYNYLGLAKRAGKIFVGDKAMAQIKSGKCPLLFISDQASERTKKQLFDKCKTYQQEYVVVNGPMLSYSIGYHKVSVCALMDRGMYNAIKKLMKEV